LVEKAARQFLNEQVNDRLKNALGGPDYLGIPEGPTELVERTPGEPELAASTPVDAEVVTTEDELEGYRVVRAIVCSEVSCSRVVGRDTKTYFGILLDDNNRKPIARLWFNRAKWYLGVFDDKKIDVKNRRREPWVTEGLSYLNHPLRAADAVKYIRPSLDLVEEKPVITLRGQQFTGHGKNVLGDPRVALTWLANELRQLGMTLKAGRVVTTGTCHPPLPIQSGDFCAVDFGSLGKVSVGFK